MITGLLVLLRSRVGRFVLSEDLGRNFGFDFVTNFSEIGMFLLPAIVELHYYAGCGFE
jgi:hypothetical protein